MMHGNGMDMGWENSMAFICGIWVVGRRVQSAIPVL